MKLLLSFLFWRAEDRRGEVGGALDRDEESGNRLARCQDAADVVTMTRQQLFTTWEQKRPL